MNVLFGCVLMQNSQSIVSLLRHLWSHINKRRRGQFVLLLALVLLTSLAEILSIGAVVPFLGMLTAPERGFDHPAFRPIIQALGLTMPEQLLLLFTVSFGVAAVTAGTMRLLLLWASTRLSFAVGAEISISIYQRTLYQPYSVHCTRNSSEVINGITGKANGVIYGAIIPTLTLISSGFILVAILVVLLAIEPVVALSSFIGFGLIYASIIRLTRKKLLTDSQIIARESNQVIKLLQEGLGGIRDVLIDGSQATYCQIYSSADQSLRNAQGNNVFISASPRYAIEALGMMLIAALAFSLVQQEDGVAKSIPILGAMALGAQRLLPVLQQAYGSWAQISGGQASLKDTLELLDQPLPAYVDQPVAQPIPFKHHITLTQLWFRYSQQAPWVLKNISITIAKGSRIGFIGTTGSGKSTLLDIVMGLLLPTKGWLVIDDHPVSPDNQRGWQAHIAHVPQTIFLADSTIEENIAFGVPKGQIDSRRVRLVAQQAQIAEIIESWPKQYQTFVGERGIRLSGGQRQRIGIARALYKQVDVIIFDEATSAQDNETEQAVMQAIAGLSKDLTLLIIAHRLTTLKNCTQIVQLMDGNIKSVGRYQDIVNRAKSKDIKHDEY